MSKVEEVMSRTCDAKMSRSASSPPLTYHQAVDHLQQIKALDQDVDRQLHAYEKVKTAIEKCTSVIQTDRVQSSKEDSLKLYERLMNCERKVAEAIRMYSSIINAAMDRIDQIDDPLLAQILMDHYIEYKEIDKLSKTYHYSKGHIHKMLKKAIMSYAGQR